MLKSITQFVEAGFALHWLRPRSKAPFESKWSDLPVATLEDLKRSYEPELNVGVRLGEPSKVGGYFLHLIDLDIRDPAREAEAKVEIARLLPGWDKLPTVVSGSGGASRHFYFLSDTACRSKKLAHSADKFTGADGREHWVWEIELFGTGKQAVIPPSIHPDTGLEYRWERPFDLDLVEMGCGPVVATSTIDAWGADRPAANSPLIDDDDLLALVRSKPTGMSEDAIEDVLDHLPLAQWCEDRDGWLQTGMALHHEYQGSDRGLVMWSKFSRKSAKFNAEDQKRVWRSFDSKPNPVRMPTLIKAAALAKLARDHGVEDELGGDDDEDDLLGDGSEEAAKDDIDAIGKTAAPGETLQWASLLDLNEEGKIKPTLHNLELIVRNDPRTAGVPRLNQFTSEIVQRGAPGVKEVRRKGPKKVRQLSGPIWVLKDKVNGDLWTDEKDDHVRSVIEAPTRQGGYGLKVSDRDMRSAVNIVARDNAFHPVREYLEALKWDGAPRVERLFIDYLGSPDSAYIRSVARLMMVAAVTRIFEPGHKFDFAVILEGLQGKRKSSFIAVLARHWFVELEGDFHDPRQMIEMMQGAWVLEIPELSGFGRADVRQIKAFVSRLVDKARLAYARRAQVFPRQSIMIGSTNDREYLRDDTGGRRFWPVECHVEEIDTDGLAVVIDQLWAEALTLYRAMRAAQPHGILPLYLTDDDAKDDALRIQEDRRVETAEDALIGQVAHWRDRPIEEPFEDEDDLIGGEMVQRQATCLIEVWVECLGNDRRSYNQMASQIIGRVMKRMPGWASIGRQYTPRYGQQRVFVRNGNLFAR